MLLLSVDFLRNQTTSDHVVVVVVDNSIHYRIFKLCLCSSLPSSRSLLWTLFAHPITTKQADMQMGAASMSDVPASVSYVNNPLRAPMCKVVQTETVAES